MNLLIFGANGQVGWELQRALAPLGAVSACDIADLDITDEGALRDYIRALRPDVIVNAAAYTAVDKAESDEAAARRLNADAVAVMADEAKALDAWLVHYSTDYVFDGTKAGAYTEADTPNPQSAYGRTKLLGERAVQESGCKHLIFRTSWVYASRGGNFVKTMLRLAAERDSLRVVADQFGAPTAAELLADVTALAVYRLRHEGELAARASGLYHLVAGGETSWHGFAQYIVAEGHRLGFPLKAAAETVQPITTAEYPVPAARPANSRLDTTKIRALLGITLPDWRIHTRRVLGELKG